MRLKYIITAVLMAGMTTSCSDFLEQDNKSSVAADGFYQTKMALRVLLTVCMPLCATFTTPHLLR